MRACVHVATPRMQGTVGTCEVHRRAVRQQADAAKVQTAGTGNYRLLPHARLTGPARHNSQHLGQQAAPPAPVTTHRISALLPHSPAWAPATHALSSPGTMVSIWASRRGLGSWPWLTRYPAAAMQLEKPTTNWRVTCRVREWSGESKLV